MANLYGVSNPIILPTAFSTLGGSSVSVTAGVDTIIATSPALAAISSGVYYPQMWGVVLFQLGVGTPTGLYLAAKIASGASFQTLSMTVNGWAASSWQYLPFTFVGPASTVPWQGAGSTLSLIMNCAGSGPAVWPAGTFVYATLYRAPDQ